MSSREYSSWYGARNRCHNLDAHNYQFYGGRGIQMCERWRNSFAAFLEDMGRRPTPSHSIDRINCDGHYEPDNCRWATREEQARNTRRAIDMTGLTFGRLTVVALAEVRPSRHRYWICQCSCGRTKEIYGRNLRLGLTTSCGCKRTELHRARLWRTGRRCRIAARMTTEYR